jgi:hypothetical protein
MTSSERVVGWLKSATVGQAALLAAIATILEIVEQTIDAALPLRLNTEFPLDSILLLVFGFYVPLLAWLAFFGTIYRERTGRAGPFSSRAAAWIALALGIVLPLFYAEIPAELRMLYVTPLGEARRVLLWAAQSTWVVFLCVYALNPNDPRIPKIAQGLALVTGLEFMDVIYGVAFYTHFEIWWNYHWARTFWHAVTIAIRILASGSHLLFAWTVWRSQSSAEARAQPFDGIA